MTVWPLQSLEADEWSQETTVFDRVRAEVDWDPSRQLSGSLSDESALSRMPQPLQKWEKAYLGEGKRL